MMKKSGRVSLPLQPLLHAYCHGRPGGLPDLEQWPGWGSRLAAIGSARDQFLFARFLETAPDSDLRPHLERFYDHCVPRGHHRAMLARSLGLVRHGLVHLLQGLDPLPRRLENCLSSRGPYYVAGLGPAFWGAIAQALSPRKNPSWTADILGGLRRLGLARWPHNAGIAAVYAGLSAGYGQIQAMQTHLSAGQIDHFLTLVARMPGRDPWAESLTREEDQLPALVARLRQAQPLRQRLQERGQELARAQELIQEGLSRQDGKQIGLALMEADPVGAGSSPLNWGEPAALLEWVGRIWQAEAPEPLLRAFWQQAPLPGAGLWLPAAVLHLRDPQRFALFNHEIRQGLAVLDDSFTTALPPEDGYRLANEAAAWLRQRYLLHPLEVPAVLAAAGERGALAPCCQETEQQGANVEQQVANAPRSPAAFHGFCPDTFRFLAELQENNDRSWMEANRERYRFSVRQPLIELCQALAQRYIEPVLRGVHGWPLITEARTGQALTSICRNAYGRGDPYNTELWIAFARRSTTGSREDAQLFVRLDAHGLRYGLRVGRKATAAVVCFRQNVQRHTDTLWQKLHDNGALDECQFGQAEGAGQLHRLAGPSALWDWAAARSFQIARTRPFDDPLLASEELVGEILLTFDRLLPALACALEPSADEPPGLSRREDHRDQPGGSSGKEQPRFTEDAFLRETGLSPDWLRRTRELLNLKRQLILQGVPGTGKTHVARCLARFLTAGRDDCIRLVQLHPAYSYEEFVEGIKVRSVEVEGRHDVTYPVEEGLLCSFAAEAARQPALPHVLILDEINRGNLPRLFGELLYLLEYRGQSVRLPYSRRDFQLPANLYLLGTMNAADRSVVLLDQALRRRFSLVEMVPDARILASWLTEHPPAAGPSFTARVLGLFERLNARLSHDIGPQGQIGHSLFMVPDLDEARLRLIWQHQVWPLLEEHLTAQPRLLISYSLDELLNESPRRSSAKQRRTAPLPS